MVFDIFKYLKPKGIIEEEKEEEEKEKKEEEKEKEPLDLNKYIFPKGTIEKVEPDPFDVLNETIEKNYKKYQSLTKKLEAYQEEYDYAPDNIKPTIAANFNKLVEEQGGLVKQLQSDIKGRDLVIDTKYKDTFIKLKQLTELPGGPTKPTQVPEPVKKFGVGVETEVPSSQFGISALTTPEKLSGLEKGIIGAFGTWEAKKRAMPELQQVEDFGREVLSEANKWAEELKGVDWKKSGSNIEQVSIIYERLTGESRDEALAEIKGGKDLNRFFINPPEKYKEAVNLHHQLTDIHIRGAEPGKDIIGQLGWTGIVAVLGYQVVAGAISVSPTILDKIKNKQIVKNIPQSKAFKAILEVTKGTDTVAQRNIFNNIIADAQKQKISVGKIIRGGYSFAEKQPRFAFGTKLYSGIPVDEMVKSIVSAGKLTKDIVNALKVMNPVDTGLVFQQLSMASPAIASKIASEFVDLIPQKITKIPKVEEEMTSEELEELKALREARVVPEEITKERVLEKVEPPVKEAIPKVEVKEPVIRVSARQSKADGGKLIDIFLPKNIADKIPKNMEWTSKIKGLPKELDKYTMLLNTEEVQEVIAEPTPKVEPKPPTIEKVAEVKPEVVVEELEPTPEEIKEVFMKEENLETTVKNRELFYEKYNNVYVETKENYDKLLEEQIGNLKEEGFKGVEEGGLKRDEEGHVIGRLPTVSKNPKWYRDFYARENKKPSNVDLREIAKDQLLRGHLEDYGEVSASETFVKLEAQLDSYEAILSDIRDGDYSFETPKNIVKLNEKLKEMKKENKKMVKDLKTELATLKAERETKYVGLKKEVEAVKKVEVEIEIKKGLKVAKAELKGRAIKGMPKAEIEEGNKLIKEISVMVKQRGFTDKQYSDIKMKYGGARHLTGKTKRMTIPQLKAVLRAIETARPRQIGHERVITLKTEKKIQSLKDSLIDKQQMSEEAYKEVLKDVGIYKEPKYVDARHFITEEKGKKLIYRLIDESNLLRITEPLRIALEKNPEAKKLADAMESRIRLEGKERKKDPHELNSMRKYIQIMEGMTNAPFFSIYQDLIDSHLENRADLNNLIMEFDEFRDVIKDEEALKRVEIWILNKSNLKGVPEVSKKITKEEIALAKKIQEVLKDYEAKARTEKFLDNIEDLKKMPQYIKYRKEINKARDIYESKGYDELVEYMKTQEWGVIKSGYDPLQVVSAQVRLHRAKSTTLGKNHIKVRKDIEYKEQDKNVMQRLFSYKRQMDNLSVMRLKIRAFVTLTDKNLDKFKDPNRVKTNIEVFFRELKGYDREDNWLGRGLNRLYAQAMTTIILGSPALAFRNLGQNIGLGHDKMMLIDPRNKNLTPEEIDYLETYVQQAEFMRIDWFMTGEKPLPGLKFLTDIIKKVNLYPRSDIANRHWGYWAKINQIRMAFDKDISLKKKMEEAKFSDMTLLEQKRALQILSKDGQKAMEKYVARVYVDDTHFIYERAQRAPAEMGRMGRILGNLMLFPRAYWEKLAQHSKKMTDKRAPFREQVRAFKVIASVLIGGALVSVAYKKVTGRRKSPYDPFELLAYQPGGLALQTIGAVSDVFTNFVLASKGDEKALADLTTSIPNALDMFIPFYNYALRGIEATTDTKNIDRLALRRLRMLIDKEYQIRGGAYKLERNAMEKWQYFLGGAGIDVSIKEREKIEKERGKFPAIKFPGKGKFTTIKFPKR